MPLLGRDPEISEVGRALAETRLLIVCGPPGVGKSALARAAAPADAVVVSLRQSSSRDDVMTALALALGVQLPATRSQEDEAESSDSVVGVAGARVLVLDDADRAAPLLAPLLTRWLETTAARFIVTCRAALDVPGARTVTLVGLATASACAVLREHVPSIDDASARTIADAVGGLPLALEIAAGRAAILGAAAVAQALEVDRDAVSGDRMARALELTWNLLSPMEQTALGRLSVVRGGLSLSVVAMLLGPEVADPDRLVEGLVRRWLLRSEPASLPGQHHFSLIAGMGAYAASKVDETTRDEARARLCDGLIEAVRWWRSRLWRRDGDDARRHLEAAVDLLLQVGEMLAERGDGDRLAELALAMDPVLWARGPHGRHLALLERAAAQAPEAWRARVLVVLAEAYRSRGELARATELARRAAAEGEDEPRGEALIILSATSRYGRNMDEAERLAAEARRLLGGPGVTEPRGLAVAEAAHASVLAERGRLDEAAALLERAHKRLEACADDWTAAAVVGSLGNLYLDRWELGPARRKFADAVRELGRIGDRRHAAIFAGYLAITEHAAGANRAAAAQYAAARGDLRGNSVPRFAALVAAAHACCLAELGEIASSRAALTDAFHLAARVGDPALDATLRIYDAAVTSIEGDTVEADQRIAAVERHAEELDDVRVALRIADAARAPALIVDAAGRWWRHPDAAAVSLDRHPTHRDLLLALVDNVLGGGEGAVAADALFAVAWPGDRAEADSARHRVRVAMSTLRRGGLNDHLVFEGGGYRLRPGTRVRIVV